MLIFQNPLRYRYHNSGAILFFALWTLVLLVILSMGIANRVSLEIRLARYLDERTISLYLAKAALNQVMLELEKDETPSYDTFYELKRDKEKELGNGGFTLNLSDEESRININTSNEVILGGLPGLNSELAGEIIEYRNKNGSFLLKEELLLVDDDIAKAFLEFKDLITIYGEGKVNINTASSTVLKILGLGDDVIETILSYRKGDDGEEGTEDDGVYASVPDNIPEGLRLLFTVASKNLKMSILTKVLGQSASHYNVVLERPKKIKFWQEK